MNCTFKCQYCQNWTISQGFETGGVFIEEELSGIKDKVRITKKCYVFFNNMVMYKDGLEFKKLIKEK